jgi:putative aldouronate transport system substrate-binding protein
MKRILLVLICCVISTWFFGGCGKAKGPSAGLGSETLQGGSADAESISLPIVKEPIRLSVFCSLEDRAAVSIKSYGEMIAFQELEKRTGIKLEWRQPPASQVGEQFNLMLASNDLCDLMYYGWRDSFIGGPERALDDGIIMDIGNLIIKYAPNFSKLMEDDNVIRRDTTTDTGRFYMLPMIRPRLEDRVSGGFQIRKDWLDKLNLDMPTTLEEWHGVLKAFKERDPNGNGKADEIPFINSKTGRGINGVERFSCAWGFTTEYYMIDRKVKFGPIQPEYQDFLLTMRKWYQEGLIDPDFLVSDRKDRDAKMISELAGAYYGLLNSEMGTYTTTMRKINPAFDLRYTHLPKAPDGQEYCFYTDVPYAVMNYGYGFATTNKYPVESMKMLDYFYGEEGRVLMSLGIEGVTYKIENGEYKFTDLVLNNPDGLPMDRAISKYTPAGISARLYQDPRYWDQMMALPNQKEGIKILCATNNDRMLPKFSLTPDESSRLSIINSEVDTYRGEMFAKFIMGQSDINKEFDNYLAVLKTLNIDEAIAIQQKALDRYYSK